MNITIDDEVYEVTKVQDHSYLPLLDCRWAGADRFSHRWEFYVAESTEKAGEAARRYWVDMAENDRGEFACIVGAENLVAWALGESAGPGSTHVHSLEEWFDLCATVPEEQWASYDGTELDVDEVSEALAEKLGFVPTVAYRHN